MAFNQDLKAIVPGPTIDADFLLYALEARKQELVRSIGSSAHGTKRLGTSSLEELQIPMPPTDEQLEIGNALRACEDKNNALEREALLLDELFRALLDELMTGRRRIRYEQGM